MSDPVVSPNDVASKPPGHDIFCTPENSDFISKVTYKSLSKTDQEIRLLKILPDTGSGFVECELLPSVRLADVQEQYLALSYCAGSAKDTKPIKVNGVNSNVFANLHHALTSAHHYWETHADQQDFLLWVDQICINQFDLAERSHQVGFMGDIYQNAKDTLVCLSTSEIDGEKMRWLIELWDEVAQKPTREVIDHYIKESETDKFAEGLVGFCDIVASPWWGRTWVFQEFMVSRHATFLYGKYAMSYSLFDIMAMDLCTAIQHIAFGDHPNTRLKQHQPPTNYTSFHDLSLYHNALSLLTARRKKPVPSDLVTLLIYTNRCGATDKRDKIYSVLGLASPGYQITPDYSSGTDMKKLLVETTKKIITFRDSLLILSYKILAESPTNQIGLLPSWVMDWENIRVPFNWRGGASEPAMGFFTYHKIAAGTIDASFVEVPHPERPQTLTTTLQVWAILLDTSFQFIETQFLIVRIYEGARHYRISSFDPVESDQELWILCGAPHPILLRRYSFGHQISSTHIIIELPVTEGVRVFPEFMDDQGVYDTNKMNWKKITIF